MIFELEDLNEELFDRVVCFSYSYPSGLGGPGSMLMYTENGEEYLILQDGFSECEWEDLDEIIPFRDEKRYKEYYCGIGYYLYIRQELYDEVIFGMEAYQKYYHMTPTENHIIWKLLDISEKKVKRMVYAGAAKEMERDRQERERREAERQRFRLSEDDMEWKDIYFSEREREAYMPEGCYTTLYKRNENDGITGAIWSILYQQDRHMFFDEDAGKWTSKIEAYNIFFNKYESLEEPLSFPPLEGGEEPVTYFNPGRFFCSCQTLEDAKHRIAARNECIGWGCYTKENVIVPTEEDWKKR